MKGIAPLLLGFFCLSNFVPQAIADPFIQDDDHGSAFHSHLSDFSRSLDDTANRMRADADYASTQQAQRFAADVQAAQDTHNVSQQMFYNAQMQANTSGGMYNGNGSYGYGNGMGIGGWAIVPMGPNGPILPNATTQNNNGNNVAAASPGNNVAAAVPAANSQPSDSWQPVSGGTSSDNTGSVKMKRAGGSSPAIPGLGSFDWSIGSPNQSNNTSNPKKF